MGRELRRKEAKKNKKNNVIVKEEELNSSINLISFLKLVCFIGLLLFVIYYILAVFVTKEIDISNGNKSGSETSQYDANSVTDSILASNIFNQTDSVYYVYFYDFSSKKEEDNLSSLISSSTDIKVYKVDTGSGLNSKYVVDDKGNKDVNSIDNLKVVSNTLIKIDHDKVVEYFEGKSDILSGIKG